MPVGFSPITVAEGQGTKFTGFVIRNNTDRNEFVWVPVEGMSYTYNRYAFLTNQPEDSLDEGTQSMKIKLKLDNSAYFKEAMPNDEQTSVATYGGYYIGRYEAGIEGGTSNIFGEWSGGTLVIQSGKNVWSVIAIFNASKAAEKLYNKETNNVASKLCSSYAWDTALKFIETQNSSYLTSGDGGNYNTSSGGSGQNQKTGYDRVHPCNIYDLGGNVREWTSEIFVGGEISCTLRGGSYNDSKTDNPASKRESARAATTSGYIGFRISLFM